MKERVNALKQSGPEWIKEVPDVYDVQDKENKYRVLIIVADSALRQRMVSSFTRAGFSVDYTESYQQALRKIKLYNPDLAVVDSLLPDIDGFLAGSKLRNFFDIPVVLIGQDSNSETWNKVLESGVDHYEIKPCKYPSLTARIKAIIRRNKQYSYKC